MFHKDYIVRQIQFMTEAIASVVFNKETSVRCEIQSEVNQTVSAHIDKPQVAQNECPFTRTKKAVIVKWQLLTYAHLITAQHRRPRLCERWRERHRDHGLLEMMRAAQKI